MEKDIRACIFDLDGVIVDTAKYHYLSWKNLFQPLDYDFHEHDNEPLKGASRMHSLEMILDMAGMDKTQSEKEELCRVKNDIYLASIEAMTGTEILPGVAKLIQTMKQRHEVFCHDAIVGTSGIIPVINEWHACTMLLWFLHHGKRIIISFRLSFRRRAACLFHSTIIACSSRSISTAFSCRKGIDAQRRFILIFGRQ